MTGTWHHLTRMDIEFAGHDSTYNHDIYITFWTETNTSDSAGANRINTKYEVRLKENPQGLFRVVEPEIRKKLELALTTEVKLTWMDLRFSADGVKRSTCKHTCSAKGCKAQQHTTDVPCNPKYLQEVNYLIEKVGLTLKTNGEDEPLVAEETTTRLEFLDTDA